MRADQIIGANDGRTWDDGFWGVLYIIYHLTAADKQDKMFQKKNFKDCFRNGRTTTLYIRIKSNDGEMIGYNIDWVPRLVSCLQSQLALNRLPFVYVRSWLHGGRRRGDP